jgi:hypothetical protein
MTAANKANTLSTPYLCPKCKKPFDVPFEKHGARLTYNPKVKCSLCKKDVSKQFFKSLLNDAVKFKWDEKIGRKKSPKVKKKAKKKPLYVIETQTGK